MLTVYRASAGSGKTFQLTLEYLKLLFHSDNAYQHILAVTFTNKATDEMKRRIIDELHGLSSTPDQSAYRDLLAQQTLIPAELIPLKAAALLRDILHDFSGFNISTIDRFFQQTTRAFTREIGLQGGYNLELDSQYVLSQAIDNMLFGLEDDENRELLQWLLQFSSEKVENGLSWDIRRDIASLATEIFNEQYKCYRQEILVLTSDKRMLSNYLQEMGRVRKTFETRLKAGSEAGAMLIKSAGLSPDDFKGSSRSPFFWFDKWANGNLEPPKSSFEALLDSCDKWITAKSNRKNEIEALYPQLNESIRAILQLFKEEYPIYLSAVETAKNIYTLGILSDIDRFVQQYQQEHNILLLSDTSELLNNIIDGSDTPFIYEKIGTQINHYMVDEFQDTSRLQWQNFRPLFNESLDKNELCLIVGDVKQSIYRWRNSDWKLLNHQLAREIPARQRQDAVLNTNWRSGANIIRFNNTLFTQAAKLLQDEFNSGTETAFLDEEIRSGLNRMITDAYADICQQIPHKVTPESGHVRVQFLADNEEQSVTEQLFDRLPETLMQLQDSGYQLKDIAFLVRSKAEGAQIAQFLLQQKELHASDTRYRFDVISDEALFLSASVAVKLLVRLLNYLHRPEESLNQILAAYEYYRARGCELSEAIRLCFEQRESEGKSLPEEIDLELKEIGQLPLFEICERLIALFPFENSREQVFIQAFQDAVIHFMQRDTADLGSFLQWWEDTGCKKTISTPESQDAIRILTIHKSKGLAFKAVIIPFCNWEIDHAAVHSTILWCNTTCQPFNKLPLIPIRYSGKLKRTIFAPDYFTEKIHAYIDNLNLAYVAFTRAREELIIFALQPKNRLDMSAVLTKCFIPQSDLQLCSQEKSAPMTNLAERFNLTDNVYEIGNRVTTSPAAESAIQEMKMPHYSASSPNGRLQLRLFSNGFFGEQGKRDYGNLMHAILSQIHSVGDIPKAVTLAFSEGRLPASESQPVIEKLIQQISQPEVSRWFSPGNRILVERDILRPQQSSYRPDRVVFTSNGVEVIDYKFGTIERKSYIKQVESYVNLIRNMGYPSVTGHIWYVELDKIISLERS